MIFLCNLIFLGRKRPVGTGEREREVSDDRELSGEAETELPLPHYPHFPCGPPCNPVPSREFQPSVRTEVPRHPGIRHLAKTGQKTFLFQPFCPGPWSYDRMDPVTERTGNHWVLLAVDEAVEQGNCHLWVG